MENTTSSISTENDCFAVWENCLQVIRQQIEEQAFMTWFEPIKPYRLEKNVLTIQVPSKFFYEYLEENFVTLLRKAIDFSLGEDGRLEYSIVVDEENQANQAYYAHLTKSREQHKYAKGQSKKAQKTNDSRQMYLEQKKNFTKA